MTYFARSVGRCSVLILLPAILLTGCNTTPSGPSRLQLSSLSGRKVYTQEFSQAFFAETTNGDWEVVLIDNGRPTQRNGADKALQPDDAAPLRQVVAVRVHWRPPSGVRTDHPSATNSVVDWYVMADSSDPMQDRLHYQGAAFVKIFPDGEIARVQIRKGQLTLVSSSGALQDPIGASSLSGSFVARRNDTMVAAITAPIRLESLSRVRQAGDRRSPPPRDFAAP